MVGAILAAVADGDPWWALFLERFGLFAGLVLAIGWALWKAGRYAASIFDRYVSVLFSRSMALLDKVDEVLNGVDRRLVALELSADAREETAAARHEQIQQALVELRARHYPGHDARQPGAPPT